MKQILLVEDDHDIAALLRLNLEDEGYAITHEPDGGNALQRLDKQPWDAVILDLMLPNVDGLEICRRIRQMTRYLPIIIISARSSETDRITGLETGADDYLVKPFSFQELEARIKALLRRSGNESVHTALRCGDLVLDPPSHRAIRNGKVIDLTVKEYRLLEYFIQNQGMALSRMNLLKNVWDKDFDTNTNVVDVYVNYLRTKIDKDFEPKLIRTVVGVGYMMEA